MQKIKKSLPEKTTHCVDFMEGEVDRLYALIEEHAGPLAVDGGRLGHDIFGHLPQLGWQRLVATFLRTYRRS